MAMSVSELSLNTREGFNHLFSYGQRLCNNWLIPASELPVALVIEDYEDMIWNPESTLPIKPILDLSRI